LGAKFVEEIYFADKRRWRRWDEKLIKFAWEGTVCWEFDEDFCPQMSQMGADF